jgi:hypothetical protein
MKDENAMSEGDKLPEATIQNTITDEFLRYRIRKLMDDPKPPSRWRSFFKSPLFSLVLGIALSGLLGTWLTHYYSTKQSELEHHRSLSDELDKIRVNKITEVWEKVYLYEASVAEAMQVVEVTSDAPQQGKMKITSPKELKEALESVTRLKKEFWNVLNKNRPWLEGDSYSKIKEYADIMFEYYFAKQTGRELEKWEEKRASAVADLNQTRDRMLNK